MKFFDRISVHARHTLVAWRKIRKNWIVSTIHKFIILFFISSLVLIIWRWRLLPPLIPLWYSRPWGIDQLANPFFIFVLPVGSLVWYWLTILISIYITYEYLIFTQVMFLTSLVLSIMSFITVIKILFLVT